MRNSFNYPTSEYGGPSRINWVNSPFEIESDFDLRGCRAGKLRRRQLWRSETSKPHDKVRSSPTRILNVFLDRDKVVVVAFWVTRADHAVNRGQ